MSETPKIETPETDERAKNSSECLAFPNEIAKDMGWSPEADMMMQINESVLELNDTMVRMESVFAAMLLLMNQASEAAAAYLESQTKE